MKKKLKIWNGRGHGKFEGGSMYVCATSVKQAAELLREASGAYLTINEIKHYYSPCWGTSMEDVTPEIGVWATTKGNKFGKPKRVL